MSTWSLHNLGKSARAIGASRLSMRTALVSAAVLAFALPCFSQTINMFPKNYKQMWTRIPIPPTKPAIKIDQWHIYPKKGEIVCDGNQGHEWLRFNRELKNFDLKVEWRFTPAAGKPHYNSGVFFRNSKDGAIWQQAQTSLAGGYIFGNTPINGKVQRFSLQKQMTQDRVRPVGQWNAFDIRCVGKTCTLAVNGKQVNTLHFSITKGYVGLEAEGVKITFRHFHLEELP